MDPTEQDLEEAEMSLTSTPVKQISQYVKHTPIKISETESWPYPPQGVDKNIKKDQFNMMALKNNSVGTTTYVYYNRRGLNRPTAHFILEGPCNTEFDEALADEALNKYIDNYPKEDFGIFTIITKSYERVDRLAIDFMKLAWKQIAENHNSKIKHHNEAILYNVGINTTFGRHFHKADVLGLKLSLKDLEETYILDIYESLPMSKESALRNILRFM